MVWFGRAHHKLAHHDIYTNFMTLSPAAFGDAFRAIEQHQKLLVIPHANVDPDCLSSALACYQMFRALGKNVTVICPDTPPESLQFLPGYEKMTAQIAEGKEFVITINLDEGVEIDTLRPTIEGSRVNIIVAAKRGSIKGSQVIIGEGERKYDLIVAVDTADMHLFGTIYSEHVDLFSEVPILNIDHHISNTRYGQMHLIDPTCASATEVLYNWFTHVPAMQGRITPDMATLLLTGLITDTRSFQNPNTTPRSLEVAAQLLEKGARQQEIIQHVYKTKPLSTLKIWGRALNHIQVDPQSRIVWSVISREDLTEMEAKSSETHGILDELISTIPDADVHVLFTETEDGTMKASMRSSSAVDASLLAGQTYGGGGHPRAAGFKVQTPANFALQVLECVQTLKEGMGRQRDGLDKGHGTEEPERTSDKGHRTSERMTSSPAVESRSPMSEVRSSASTSIDVVARTTGQKDSAGQDIVQSLAKGPAFQ